MDSFLGALAEPWARRWSGKVAGAALAFWAAGVFAYLIRAGTSAFACRPTRGTASPALCSLAHAGALGTGVAVAVAAVTVIGSAMVVAALSPRVIDVLAGERWPCCGPAHVLTEPVLRWLLRRQIDRRGAIAAAGRPVPDQLPVVAAGPDRRRRGHQAMAAYAANRSTDRAVMARLRRYPVNTGDTGPTRLGSALAATHERVRHRHGLELPVCWEPLIAVLPDDARDWLARESTRVTLRGQSLLWALAATGWAVLFRTPWAAAIWVAGLLVVARGLHAGLRESVETYCDLIEATVAVHRHRLYQALGVPLPDSAVAETVAGQVLSAYLAGAPVADLRFSWPDSGDAARNEQASVAEAAHG